MSICHFFTLISKEVRRIFIALYDSTVHQNVVVNKLNVVIYSCFSCELEAMTFFIYFHTIQLCVLQVLGRLFQSNPVVIYSSCIYRRKNIRNNRSIIYINCTIFQVAQTYINFANLLQLSTQIIRSFNYCFIQSSSQRQSVFCTVISLEQQIVLRSGIINIFITDKVMRQYPYCIFRSGSSQYTLKRNSILKRQFCIHIGRVHQVE